MGAALGEAWLGAGLVDGIDAVDPIRAQDVQARLYRQAADLPDPPYDLVVMAVKPVMAREALSALPASQLQNATIISVMAGVPLQTLRASLPLERPVVRSMPNTAVMVRQGCVGLYADEDVSPALRQTISRLFDAVGRSFWVDDEAQLHAVTAISGSGPAYVFYLLEALQNAARQQGFNAEEARQLSLATFQGAVRLAEQSGEAFSDLRQKVTSKGGTTYAALQSFEAHGVADAIGAGVAACVARSQELAEQLAE